MSKKPLIIGIDPGSTSAVAGVNLNGELELLESGKNFPPRQIIQKIIEAGKPIVVTSDKAKMPSKVNKIAVSLGTETYVPEEDLSKQKKRALGRGENSHEIDASASAFNAYNNLQKEINKIQSYSERLDISKAESASRYFSEGPVAREQQRNSPEDSDREEPEETVERTEEKVDPEKQRMRRKIENMEEEISSLRSQIGELKSENEGLREKMREVKEEDRKEVLKEREVTRRDRTIQEKSEEIEEMEEELEKANIREKQYRKALDLLAEGGEIIEIVTRRTNEVPDKAVTRSEDLKEEMERKGFDVRHVDELDAVELERYVVVDEFPKPKNFQDIIDEYRESR